MNSQDIARLQFVPFTARVFSNRPFQHSEKLPVRDPSALTLDTVQRCQQIIARGVWYTLCKLGGWRHADYIEQEQKKSSPIWMMDKLPQFRYSDASMDMLLEFFNRTRDKRQLHPGTIGNPKSDGDRLVQWIIWERLNGMENDTIAPWTGNPLTMLSAPHHSHNQPLDLSWLMQPSCRELLPWLSIFWLKRWASIPAPDSELALRDIQRASAVMQAWLELSQQHERFDLINTVLAFYSRQLEEKNLAAFAQWYRLKVSQRKAGYRNRILSSWLAVFEPARYLVDTYLHLTRLHPVDRRPSMGIFMNAYHKSAFEQSWQRWRQYRQKISPTIH